MATITIEVPDERKDRTGADGSRLPELLLYLVQQPAGTAHIYRYILNFMASQPTKEQYIAFPSYARDDRALGDGSWHAAKLLN